MVVVVSLFLWNECNKIQIKPVMYICGGIGLVFRYDEYDDVDIVGVDVEEILRPYDDSDA